MEHRERDGGVEKQRLGRDIYFVVRPFVLSNMKQWNYVSTQVLEHQQPQNTIYLEECGIRRKYGQLNKYRLGCVVYTKLYASGKHTTKFVVVRRVTVPVPEELMHAGWVAVGEILVGATVCESPGERQNDRGTNETEPTVGRLDCDHHGFLRLAAVGAEK